jgi:hypothetical protein
MSEDFMKGDALEERLKAEGGAGYCGSSSCKKTIKKGGE